MPEPLPHADDAAAYVLGTLGARDRRRFEAHLRESPELRKVVRLLEAGSIGLAMAAPHREPPIRIWAGIQTAVTHECEKRGRSVRRKWLRNVAGIAACAIVGWFAYTSWNHRPSSASPTIASDVVEAQVTNSPAPVLVRATLQASNSAGQPPRESRAQRPENATLRERVGDLENQVAHLAQTVTQHQATPPDLNRLTFVNIIPEGSDGAASPQIAPASPELRRALLLGVARQLGWMPPSPAPQPSTLPPPSPAPSTPPYTQPAEHNPPAPQNDLGVQFVDLPPVEAPSPETTTASVQTPPSPPTTTTTASEESSSRSASSIPAFVSGTNLVFAVDSSVVPVGTETVSFYSGNGGGSVVLRGAIPLGNNPTVVTMPIFLQVRAFDSSGGSPLFQTRTWDSSGGSQPFAARILYGVSLEGTAATFRFTLPDPSSTSP
jgi:hypothetical protein